jgi:Dyp-type peroxidase family
MPAEPLLDADDLQGHVVPGYGPSDVCLLGVTASTAGALRALLREVQPHVTVMRAAMGHRAQKKAHLMNLGARPSSRWHVHVALTRRGLDLLGYQQRGVDRAFDAGMTGLSTGDPKQAVRADGTPEPAHPRNWRVGGPERGIDVLVMLIAEVNMRAAIEPLRARLTGLGGIQIVYEELGEDLLHSREHFGFQDGISQPGLYGEYDDDGQRRPITTRYGVPRQNGLDFGKPGQPLVWPGRFIVGAPRFEGDTPALDPLWVNGSFLVFRRLEQDVAAFYADTEAMAAALAKTTPGFDGDAMRAFIVGRRPDGRSLMRPGAGPDDKLALNHFFYQTAASTLTLPDGTSIPGAVRDVGGTTCPFWAHVRKVNPRDGPNDLSVDAHNLQLLRRGVPFGPAYNHTDLTAASNQASRGLLFLAYQSDIHEQFENLNSHWMNQFDQPAGGGHDLFVGLSLDGAGQLQPRRADWPQSTQQVVAQRHWVIPTGGAYLFAPSIRMIQVLATTPGPG